MKETEFDPLISTFNMICDRLSNCEETMDTIKNAMIYNELRIADGYLNHKLLGYSFEIMIQSGDNNENKNTGIHNAVNKVYAVFVEVELSGNHKDCKHNEILEKSYETIKDGKKYFKEEKKRDENYKSEELGIVSKFKYLCDHLLNDFISTNFKHEKIENMDVDIEEDEGYLISFEGKTGYDYVTYIDAAIQVHKIYGHSIECIKNITLTPIIPGVLKFTENARRLLQSEKYMNEESKEDLIKKVKSYFKYLGFHKELKKHFYCLSTYEDITEKYPNLWLY